MTDQSASTWEAANCRYLSLAVAWVRAQLVAKGAAQYLAARPSPPRPRSGLAWLFGGRRNPPPAGGAGRPEGLLAAPTLEGNGADQPAAFAERALAEMADISAQLAAANQPPPALEQISQRLRLSRFETEVLLLCLATELELSLADHCAWLHREPARAYPTFSLALDLFDDPDWRALAPEATLRRLKLLQVDDALDAPLVARLRLSERLLHFAKGLTTLAADTARFVSPMRERTEWDDRSPTQPEAAERIATLCHAAGAPDHAGAVVHIQTSSRLAAVEAAAGAAQRLGLAPFELSLARLPPTADLDEFACRWERESRLLGLALLIDAGDAVANTPADSAANSGRLSQLLASCDAVILVWTGTSALPGLKCLANVEIVPSSPAQQRADWERLLPPQVHQRGQLAGELSRQFSLDRSAIGQIAQLSSDFPAEHSPVASPAVAHHGQRWRDDAAGSIWHACRLRSRPGVDGLAQRVDARATWDALVVRDECRLLLRQIAAQVRHRWRVYDDWGLGARLTRGLGIGALFAGESGTGKTMAAEVLATELQLDLYRVDLSSVLDKYVGETEKHLRRLFDAFESCGAILLFDEADALFGKRSEVRDSHDRYANLAVNYLLQRLESYTGLALLTTNRRCALDPCFLRRFRFVVTFTTPGQGERLQIWRRLLPPAGEPTAESDAAAPRLPVDVLDYERLSRFELTGGHILNVVLNAAFRAADRPAPKLVSMIDVLPAVRDEYVKLGRPINEPDFRVTDRTTERVA